MVYTNILQWVYHQSPMIADIVMQDLETECMNTDAIRLTFYYQYIEDIELTAPFDKIDLIFKTFNNYHNRLKFTLERENNRFLSFLDLILSLIIQFILIGFTRRHFLEDFIFFTPVILYMLIKSALFII